MDKDGGGGGKGGEAERRYKEMVYIRCFFFWGGVFFFLNLAKMEFNIAGANSSRYVILCGFKLDGYLYCEHGS